MKWLEAFLQLKKLRKSRDFYRQASRDNYTRARESERRLIYERNKVAALTEEKKKLAFHLAFVASSLECEGWLPDPGKTECECPRCYAKAGLMALGLPCPDSLAVKRYTEEKRSQPRDRCEVCEGLMDLTNACIYNPATMRSRHFDCKFPICDVCGFEVEKYKASGYDRHITCHHSKGGHA